MKQKHRHHEFPMGRVPKHNRFKRRNSDSAPMSEAPVSSGGSFVIEDEDEDEQ